MGAGEAEAIIAAQELPADLLILDDLQARNKARRLRLPFVGVLGVLIEAKHKGLIQNLHLLLQELQHTAGFHVSTELNKTILRQAGEL